MQRKYSNWIENYLKINEVSYKCREVTEQMATEFPELTRKRGIIHLLNTEENETRPHWWCVNPDGETIDPTASQYPFELEYEEWDENKGEPTGKCLCCGKFVSDFNTFCNDACETEYRIYQEEEIQKEDDIQSTGKCFNCGNLIYGSDYFCDEDCQTELLKNLEYEEALECCNEIIKINPDDIDAWKDRGFSLIILERYEEALESCNKSIELNPDDFEVWSNKGFAHCKLSGFDDALGALEKALELKPDEADIWANKGYVLDKLGKPDEALKAYEKAIELEPDCDLAWFNRACLYSVKGDKEKALSSLEKAIELDPCNKEKVKEDEDFEILWYDIDFITLVA